MAAPRFIAASTGSTDAGGAWTATCHAPAAAGNVIIFQLLQDGNTSGAISGITVTNLNDLGGSTGAVTTIPGGNTDSSFAIGLSPVTRQFLFIGRASSTSAPTIGGSNSTSEDLYWRFYEFDNVSTGTTLASVIENIIGGTALNSYVDCGHTNFEQAAQSFISSTAGDVTPATLTVFLAKVGSPTDNLVIELQSDSGGDPSGTVLSTIATVAGSSLQGYGTPADLQEKTYTFNVTLSSGTSYWLVFHRSGSLSDTDHFRVGASTLALYPRGIAQNFDSIWTEYSSRSLGFILSDVFTPTQRNDTALSVLDAAVTTSYRDRMALNFVGINDDNAISDFSGATTSGKWSLVTTAYAEASGTDAAIGLNFAYSGCEAAMSRPSDTSYSLNGGTSGTGQKFAQSINLAEGARTITSVYAKLAKVGTPTDNLVVGIYADDGIGTPGATQIGSGGSIGGASISTTATWYTFDVNATLDNATQYWIIFSRDGSRDTSNYYQLQGRTGNSYAAGNLYVKDGLGYTEIINNDLLFSTGISTYATINGGSFTQADGTDAWGTVGLALIGTTTAPPPPSGDIFPHYIGAGYYG